MAGVARQHPRGCSLRAVAEEGSGAALAQGAPLRPADAHHGQARRRDGRTGLAVLYVLLFDFLDYATGRLDPSYDAIARKAGVCRRAAVNAVHRLKTLGLLHWQRRCREDTGESGRFRLTQETNAYAVLSPACWRGYHEPPPAPPPEPGTWGDHPPLPDAITAAADELHHGQHRAMLAALDSDPGDQLAAALARLGRAVLGPQS